MANDKHLILETGGVLLGPSGKNGSKWRVTLIEEGISKNRRYYGGDMLERDARMFDGLRAFVDHPTPEERQSRPEGSVQRLAGWYDNVGIVNQGGKRRVDADLNVINPELRQTMLNAWEMGRPDLIGFSINASATNLRPATIGGQVVETVDGFQTVRSVDVVTIPGAGGVIRAVLESTGGTTMADPLTAEQIKELVESAAAKAAEEAASRTAEAFRAALLEAVEEAEEGETGDSDTDPDIPEEEEGDEEVEDEDEDEDEEGEGEEDEGSLDDAVEEALRPVMKRMQRLERELYESAGMRYIETSLAASTLPDPFKEHARTRMVELLEAGALTADSGKKIVESTAEFAGKVAPVNPTGTPGTVVTMGKDEWDRYQAGLAVMLGAPSTAENRGFGSIMEAYYNYPGQDRRWGGFSALEVFNALSDPGANRRIYDSELDAKRVQESVTTATFGQLFADVMYQRMMKTFSEMPYRDWTKLVSQRENVTDFRSRRWIRWGMYGNIPAVGQGAPYQPLTTPGDEEAYYSISKYGGLEDLTIEAVTMDNLGQLRQIPEKLSYATARTLFESMMDLATTGGLTTVTTYDGVATYASGHTNLSTSNTYLLNPDGLDSVQQAMRAQVPYGAPATEYLGSRNKIKYLIVPPSYEYRAKAFLNPSDKFQASLVPLDASQSSAVLRDLGAFGTIDPFAFANQGIEVIVYDKLTSNHNVYVFADPNQPGIETLVVGFLNGRDTPELFVQDAGTNAGSAFTADKITYKVRMFWGMCWLDHRSAYCMQIT